MYVFFMFDWHFDSLNEIRTTFEYFSPHRPLTVKLKADSQHQRYSLYHGHLVRGVRLMTWPLLKHVSLFWTVVQTLSKRTQALNNLL